jgi:hypothetical protein
VVSFDIIGDNRSRFAAVTLAHGFGGRAVVIGDGGHPELDLFELHRR